MSIATQAPDTRLADRDVRGCSRRPVSLDEPLGDGPELAAVAEDRGTSSARSTAIARERRVQVRLVLSRLDARSSRVLERWQGPTGAEPSTLE